MKLAVGFYVHNISEEIDRQLAIVQGRDTPEQIVEGLALDAEENGPFTLVCFDTFQAGFSAANAGAFNDNEAVLSYVNRLRPLTGLPGFPAALVALHPTKNATEDDISSPPCLLRLLPAGAVAGWDLHPLESAAFSRRTPFAEVRPRVLDDGS